MRKILNRIPIKGEFARNAFTLTIGTSIAQLFPILFYPILGRIFLPADFGLLATITSITAILAVLATGKYENSILITDTKKDAANIIGLVLLLSFIFLSISFILLQLFSNQFLIWFHEPNLKKWLFVCPISAYLIIIFNCYNEWCVRNKYFSNLSWNKIINASATTLGKLFFGIVKVSSNGLIIGDLVGRLVSAIGCILRALQKDKKIFIQVSMNRIKHLAERYIEFPKYALPEQLIDTVNSQLPTLTIASFFMTSDVGFYAMAGNLISVPTSVIAIAVRDVFRQRANEEWIKNGNCKNIYNKTVRSMFYIIVPASILLMIILPDLFSFLLGKNWYIAGIYARILMPNVAILFIYQVVAAVFIIANKLKASLIWQLYSISLTIIALCIGVLVYKDIKITLIIFVIARSVANITRFYMTYIYSKGI